MLEIFEKFIFFNACMLHLITKIDTIIYMNEYRRTNTTVSLLNYHFVFCPRYRRKIFLRNDVEESVGGSG